MELSDEVGIVFIIGNTFARYLIKFDMGYPLRTTKGKSK